MVWWELGYLWKGRGGEGKGFINVKGRDKENLDLHHALVIYFLIGSYILSYPPTQQKSPHVEGNATRHSLFRSHSPPISPFSCQSPHTTPSPSLNPPLAHHPLPFHTIDLLSTFPSTPKRLRSLGSRRWAFLSRATIRASDASISAVFRLSCQL